MSEEKHESNTVGELSHTDAAGAAVKSNESEDALNSSATSKSESHDTTFLDEKRAPTPEQNHPATATVIDSGNGVSTPVKQLEEASTVENRDVAATEQDEAAPEDNAAHHVHGLARLILVFGLCATTFIIGLDQMIIATAIPKITTRFKSLEEYVSGDRQVLSLTNIPLALAGMDQLTS